MSLRCLKKKSDPEAKALKTALKKGSENEKHNLGIDYRLCLTWGFAALGATVP